MKHLLITLISLFIFSCAALAQTPKNTTGKMTKQDSIVVFEQKRDAFIDTLITKTSLKDFRTWLDETVTAKMLREGTMQDLWATFINIKVNEWINRNKIPVPY